MASRKQKIQGVILGRKDFGEQDKLVEIFTKKSGKIRILAKGVRKITSRRLGYIEVGNLISGIVYSGKTFNILTEVDSLDNQNNNKTKKWQVESILYLCEVIAKLLPENQSEPEIYYEFIKTRNLVNQTQFDKIVLFENFLLNKLGYGKITKVDELIKQNKIKPAHFVLKNKIQEITEQKLISLEIFK